MEAPQLSSREKNRLDRFIKNVTFLSRREQKLNITYKFAMHQQVRHILTLLGLRQPSKIMIRQAVGIMADFWPFKKIRLRKLINNGWRS